MPLRVDAKYDLLKCVKWEISSQHFPYSVPNGRDTLQNNLDKIDNPWDEPGKTERRNLICADMRKLEQQFRKRSDSVFKGARFRLSMLGYNDIIFGSGIPESVSLDLLQA
eukprot:COSAG01_NODE_1259_length_11009_cov_53.138930_7_plen_110_part_00